MKDVIIYSGQYGLFTKGQKAPGLHLNRFVRDILRECGYPCNGCGEVCLEPNLCDKLTDCGFGGGGGTLAPGGKGDLLYYDGSDWVSLAVGTAGQVLTSVGGDPVWANALSAATYLALTDTPNSYVQADIVPTVNDALNGLQHFGNNKLHTEIITGYQLLPGITYIGTITAFGTTSQGTTTVGNHGISNCLSTSITLNPAETYPRQVSVMANPIASAKKYPLAGITSFNWVVIVNGQRVPFTVARGTTQEEEIEFNVPASNAVVTVRCFVIGSV